MGLKQYFGTQTQAFFHAAPVAENIADVTHIDEKSEVEAEKVGMTQASVNAIWTAVENLYRTGMHPGMSFCLRYKGKILLNRALGHAKGIREDEATAPVLMKTDTPVCLYSASKAVMAILVHKLAEEGHIHLLDPIAHYLPEFGQHGKKDISIYQMLAHRGGFPSLSSDVPLEAMFDRQRILDEIYQTRVKSPEGRIQAYHAVTSGFIADELVRKLTGKTIEQYLQEKIARPMAMQTFGFGIEGEKAEQVAKNYVTGIKNGKLVEGVLSKVLGVSIEQAVELSNGSEFKQAIVPSANIFTTAEEIGRFYQMLLDYGQYKKRQILQPLTVKKATREADKAKLDKGLFLPMRYSAGFMLGGDPVGMYGPNTHHAFGHLGFSNIFCWADPARDISVALLDTGKPIVGNHIVALPKLLYTISKECKIENI